MTGRRRTAGWTGRPRLGGHFDGRTIDMRTTLLVEHANCPTCFNETLERLGRLDGVRAVHGSVAGPCIEIEHDNLAPRLLQAIVRQHLHGVEMYSNEIRMMPLEPVDSTGACARHGAAASAPTDGIPVSMSLGEIVTRHPSLAADLERRGLDYCCHGGQTLAAAATAAGLDPRGVADELWAAHGDEPPAPWSELGPAELALHIESTHHQYLWDELPRLAALVEKINGVHGAHHPELADVQRLFTELRADLEPHLRREELLVFPMIRRVAGGGGAAGDSSAAGVIDRLMSEHDAVGALLTELREVTGGYAVPDDGCASYAACFRGLAELEADTHLHVHKENNVLLPALRAAAGVEPVH
jgi:regulator of cell morphogenesis and NO signaling